MLILDCRYLQLKSCLYQVSGTRVSTRWRFEKEASLHKGSWIRQQVFLIGNRFHVTLRILTSPPLWRKASWIQILWSESMSGKRAKLHAVAASSNRDHPTRSISSSPLASTINCTSGSQAVSEVNHRGHSIGITLSLLVHATCARVLIFVHIPFVVHRALNTVPTEGLQQHPLLQRTAPIARSFC